MVSSWVQAISPAFLSFVRSFFSFLSYSDSIPRFLIVAIWLHLLQLLLILKSHLVKKRNCLCSRTASQHFLVSHWSVRFMCSFLNQSQWSITGWTGLFLDSISSWSFAGSWGMGLGFVSEELAPLQLCGAKGERKRMLIELLQYLGTKGWTHEAIPSDTALHLASWTAQQLKAQTSSLSLFFLMLAHGGKLAQNEERAGHFLLISTL